MNIPLPPERPEFADPGAGDSCRARPALALACLLGCQGVDNESVSGGSPSIARRKTLVADLDFIPPVLTQEGVFWVLLASDHAHFLEEV